jgi:ferredoxin-NADP reductase
VKTRTPRQRPVSALDVAASVAARLLPSALTPGIDQARRDAHMVLDGLRGVRESPVMIRGLGPRAHRPLNEIDPVAELLPRGLAERYGTLKRDVAMLGATLAGRPPPPLVPRPPRSSPVPVVAPVPGLHSRTLRVERVVRETADAVTLVLGDPTGAPITFLPGQFFTVLVTVNGQSLRRAYSASCAPGGEGPSRVALTVKRVPAGRVSNHLNDHAVQGMRLEVLGPSGAFTPEPSDGAPRHLVLLAGGSGITPLMSIARTVLAKEPATHVSLVYGNRREADILFRDALAVLARERPGRFVLRHVLSEPPLGWEGGVGLLDRCGVEEALSALPIRTGEPATYFLCGPEPMMREARAALLARGVPAEDLREERFTQPHLRPSVRDAPGGSGPWPVGVRLQGTERALTAPAGVTVLEAGLLAGLPMPYSCAMGGCGACKVTLRAGEVRMEEPNCLTAEERARGQVLACVARPVTPVTVEVP